MKKVFFSLLTVAALVGSLLQATPAPAAGAEGIKLIKNFSYVGGTDIAFDSGFAYAGAQNEGKQKGGVRIFDVRGKTPKLVSFIECPGGQNDTAIVKKGLLALAYHSGQCAGSLAGGGVRLIDVRNPKKPKFLSSVTLPGGTHTLSVVPGTSIIYASPGGLANGGGDEQILDASNPKKLKVVETYESNPAGCHDVNFLMTKTRKLAFCAGLSEISIWDIKNPLAPVVISHIANPLMFFPTLRVATPDGKYLVVGDEAFAASDCVGGPLGSFYVYDITIPEVPIFFGHAGSKRGKNPIGTIATDWCTAHNLNFIPGTRIMVASWYSGGTSVVDFENPLLPEEIAWYQPENADTWSSYWYQGRIYANDLKRGFDVLEVPSLKNKK